MKYIFVLCVMFAGCRTAAPLAPLPPPAKPALEPRPLAAVPPPAPAPTVASITALEQKVRHQAQVIEALVSQNDALMAKVAERLPSVSEPTQPVATPTVVAEVPALPTPAIPEPTRELPRASTPAVESLLVPNSDGVIDLAATLIASNGPANPFAVRSLPPESVREVTLHVTGKISGSNPCAVINERLVGSGEAIESLNMDRIERDAVVLRYGEHRLRLPISEKPTRVRLPL